MTDGDMALASFSPLLPRSGFGVCQWRHTAMLWPGGSFSRLGSFKMTRWRGRCSTSFPLLCAKRARGLPMNLGQTIAMVAASTGADLCETAGETSLAPYIRLAHSPRGICRTFPAQRVRGLGMAISSIFTRPRGDFFVSLLPVGQATACPRQATASRHSAAGIEIHRQRLGVQ